MSPPDLLVALPARDEQDSIGACLAAVVTAVHRAAATGSVGRARVAVAAHRCTDDTSGRAGTALRAAGMDHLVLPVPEPMPVGAVRSRLIAAALTTRPGLGADTWIFSTDADSVVPADWVTATLSAAVAASADLVAGLTALADWRADEEARTAYAGLLAAGMTPTGHRHIYAANLAVRRAAYEAAGGFPALPHGEEHGLLRAVRDGGGRVLSTLHPVVATSARMPGRAKSGLGALLQRLSEERAVDE